MQQCFVIYFFCIIFANSFQKRKTFKSDFWKKFSEMENNFCGDVRKVANILDLYTYIINGNQELYNYKA